ncbi:MAG: tripartite tricarboxylate transporter substrate binding protein [Beijerinckiaceae bacterium]|nr:tripartite tricarboxylate transporter substrate binding protein [Beijerinckiaceae bacterium]
MKCFAGLAGLVAGVAALAASAPMDHAHAQTPNWPTQAIRVVVPSAAGGTTDFLARVSAEFLSSRLGQPVIIENNTGAGGNVGTASVARAAPDGHTLGFISTNNLAINQFLFKSMPYDPIKDLAPVAVVAEAPQVLVVAKNVPAQNLKEFIALLKAKPNSLNYASAGPGTTPHLAAVQFMRLADVQMTHVPYRGAAPAVTDLAAGQVQVLFVGAAPVAGVMESGDVRALAAATKARMPLLPNLPTAAEAGLPGFESTTWFGLVAPAKTPKPIVDRLNALMREWVADPKTKERFDKAYLLPMSMSADEFTKFVADEATKWEKIVADAGVKMD